MQKTILYICISIIISSIFFILIPKKNMESPIKFALNLFLICIIIAPFSSKIETIDFSKYSKIIQNNRLNLKNIEQKINESNKKNLENALKFVFLKNGYKNVDISIDIDQEEKTTNITVTIPKNKNYDEEKIKNMVKQETGIIPKVEFF